MSRSKLIILLSVLFVGFGALYFWMNRSVINRSYLASEEYQQLEQQLNNERERYESESNTPAEVFEQMIRSDENPTLDLPFRMDSLVLENYQNRFEEIPLKNNREGIENRFFKIGMIRMSDARLYLMLVKRPSIYRHLEVWITTAKDESLVDTEMIAEYKNSLTDKITTDLEIDANYKIHATVNRNREYPIVQKYQEQQTFMLTDSVTIELESSE